MDGFIERIFEHQVLQRSLNVFYLKNRFIYEIS
jgi:hypothetical protein